MSTQIPNWLNDLEYFIEYEPGRIIEQEEATLTLDRKLRALDGWVEDLIPADE